MPPLTKSWIPTEDLEEVSTDTATPKAKETSFFEFWPTWLMYAPVALQWLGLSIRYGSITLPFAANPRITLSGMVGMPKSELFSQAGGELEDRILPWLIHTKSEKTPTAQATALLEEAQAQSITLPFVCKPNIGCRGVGVKCVQTKEELAEIINSYPIGAQLMIQRLANHEPEAGVFFVKDPESGDVSIPSMTYKYTPSVIGDGKHTIGELIEKDRRAGALLHLYEDRLKTRWDDVPESGETVKLLFSASHSKGAVFKDAREDVTPELVEKLGQLMEGLPEFYYGRLDLKFPDIESLQRGEGLEIVEINGASSESIHIWDKNTRFGEAVHQLLWQYRTLFKIGAAHRKRGVRPPSLKLFIERVLTERRLTKHYPTTD